MKIRITKKTKHHHRDKQLKPGTELDVTRDIGEQYIKDGVAEKAASRFKPTEEEKNAIKEAKKQTS